MARSLDETQNDNTLLNAPPRTVLVVDDSRLQRRILTKSLSRWGYTVTEAASGSDALAICARDTPDIIVSDWMMPGMTGPEFCRAFRIQGGSHYSYFVLLTSKSDATDVAAGLDSGADDFLTKPVNGDELRARLLAGERILDMQHELSETNRIMRKTLAELQRVYDSLDKDLQEARDLQQSLIRERHHDFGGAEVSLMLRSSGHVGGDLVGYYPIDDHHVGLFGLDVSGHGISSALMTARLAGYLSAATPEQNIALERAQDGQIQARCPAEVVQELNNLVLSEMKTEHYFTMMLVVFNLSTGVAQLAQAGHPHPLVQRADGSIEQSGPGGFPVGLIADMEFNQFQLHLDPGDRLMIMSDGITECPNVDEIMLGEEGLAQMVTKLQHMRGNTLLEAIVWELSAFAGTEDFPDDVSGLVFEYSGQGFSPSQSTFA
jgi:sigma-B regulation protein RsbU (phosphoserine phosphatase)